MRFHRLFLFASLAALCSGGALSAQSVPFARVSGSVTDSINNRPLPGAVVRLVRTDSVSIGHTAISGADGRFAFDSVSAGIWLASFLHRRLDSLRLDPAVVRLEITDTGAVTMPLAIPSAFNLVSAACGLAVAQQFGMIVGEVRRADILTPMAGATVEIEWPEWVLVKKKLTTKHMRRTTRTDSLGRYTLCGAPAGSTLRTMTWHGADSSGAIEVNMPVNGYALQDFVVAPIEFAIVGGEMLGLNASNVRMRIGQGSIRGRISTTNGSPLSNAAVRILGSGSVARTSVTGEFTISDAGAGTQSVEARAIGFQPIRRTVVLSETMVSELSLILPVQNVELDTVRVFAGRELPYEVRGIERRWRSGMGQFMDGKTVQERASSFTSDALRGVSGVTLQYAGGSGQEVIMRSTNGRACRALIFVDGMRLDQAGIYAMTLDEFVRPKEVAAIEVYSRTGTVPAEYLTADGCGVVAVWTRFATGNVTIFPPKSERR